MKSLLAGVVVERPRVVSVGKSHGNARRGG